MAPTATPHTISSIRRNVNSGEEGGGGRRSKKCRDPLKTGDFAEMTDFKDHGRTLNAAKDRGKAAGKTAGKDVEKAAERACASVDNRKF